MGIGFSGMLQVALIVLKIMGYIDSWWVALIPTWIALFFCLIYVLGFIVFYFKTR